MTEKPKPTCPCCGGPMECPFCGYGKVKPIKEPIGEPEPETITRFEKAFGKSKKRRFGL